MVIKWVIVKDHPIHLEKVSNQVWAHNMCLNPKQCFFRNIGGVKFLGFIIKQRGIETHLEKCEVILSMRSSSNLKEL